MRLSMECAGNAPLAGAKPLSRERLHTQRYTLSQPSVGWRNIIEKKHMTATLTKWYEEIGKHEIFAGGNKVGPQSIDHSLVLQHAKQPDLDKLGIAKTAREEKKRARDHKLHEQQENERMAKLYRQHVLKEEPGPELVQLMPIAPAAAKTEREEVGSFGD
jgi:hypothetical protein